MSARFDEARLRLDQGGAIRAQAAVKRAHVNLSCTSVL